MKKADLYFKAGSSNKQYHVQVEKSGNGCVVNFQYGRVGSTLTTGSKTPEPVDEAEANKIFDKLVNEKKAKGYTEGESGTPYAGTSNEDRNTGLVPQLPNPIEEDEVEKYLKDPDWGMQEKKDGKHIMLSATPGKVVASNRKGLAVAMPEGVKADALKLGAVVLDGEAIGDNYWAFDCLSGKGNSISHRSYIVRYATLHAFLKDSGLESIRIVPLADTEKDKRALYKQLQLDNKEGVVFKRLAAPYVPGRPNSGGDMVKFKFYSTASCLVDASHRKGKRSVGLYCAEVVNGKFQEVPVGNVTVPPNQDIPKTGTIVEVRYLYAFKGGSLYQPVLLGVRDDLDCEDCLLKQLKYKSEEES